MITTFSTAGSSARCSTSLSTWVWFSATTIRLPELATMNATSSPLVLGYTVVVAAPADRMPKSTTTHS